MNKAQLTRELQELLDELFAPTVPKRLNEIKKGELKK